MPQERPTPTSLPRAFALEELFFSTTDSKGHIRSGNRIFARVSGYDEHALIGAAHNVIRHPDMPRVVFRLLWEYLGRGQPIAAYVKNMASDGAYYWVVASVVPVSGGYLSVRFKPSSSLFATVEGLYGQLREIERPFDERGDRRGGMDAAQSALQLALGELGFASYDDFMFMMLPHELRSRAQVLGTRPFEPLGPSASAELTELLARAEDLDGFLGTLFTQLGDYSTLEKDLSATAAYVLELAAQVRLTSQNAAVAAFRLESAGKTLGAIAHAMAQHTAETTRLVRSLDGRIHGTARTARSAAFSIAAAKLQVEVMRDFGHELASGSGPVHAARESVAALVQSLIVGVRGVFEILTTLSSNLTTLATDLDDLDKLLRTLNAVHFTGRVEAAHASDGASFESLFTRVSVEIDQAQVRMREFARVVGPIADRARQNLSAHDIISGVLSTVDRQARALHRIES
jgi:PAS domain S-box-containing protein